VRHFLVVARRPRRTLCAVVLVTLAAAIVGVRTPADLSDNGNEFLSRGTQSYNAAHTLETALGRVAFPNLAVILPKASSHASHVLAAVQRVATLVPQAYHSRNHKEYLLVGYFHRGVAPGSTALSLAREFRSFAGVQVGGHALLQEELATQTKSDVVAAETIAFPVLFLLALVIFGSLIAALLPVAVTFTALSFTLLTLGAVNAIQPVSILALNLLVGLTAGLSLDYSLLLLSRYREELPRCETPQQAAFATVLTAGRTVAISSLTVAIAFASPLIFPVAFARSLAIAGMVTALIVGLASLVVLPAALALLGSRINRFTISTRANRASHSWWNRIARSVVARPSLAALLAITILVALSTPALGMRLTGFASSSLPAGAGARSFEERIRSEFEAPLLNEVVVAAKADAHTVTHRVAPALERLPDVAAGVARHIRGDLWVVSIKTASAPFSSASQRLVRKIRALPFHLAVTGTTAAFLDTKSTLQADAPFAAVILISLTLVLLFAATGSVILPFFAVAVNILSFASALGLTVFVFQGGRLAGLFDYRSLGALLVTQPALLAAGGFGILTDYGVFMLTRIREGWETGLSTVEAVVHGMERTGPVISSAAVLLCVAVGSLMTAKMVFVKELGFGIVAAVIIDVTVVRALLLPSLIVLPGRWTWWRPRVRELGLAHRSRVRVATRRVTRSRKVL
jgi:uncharacterized membrane protein YdfJ with MMPL/SSD domain